MSGNYGQAAVSGLLDFGGPIGKAAGLAALPMMGMIRKVAPQDEALRIAQINAAKPVSEGGLGLPKNNTPMDRARAMGYEPAYHGTDKDIPEFKSFRPISWFAKEPDLANQFVAGGRRAMGAKSKKGSVVYPVMVKDQNPLDLTDLTPQSGLSGLQLLNRMGVETSPSNLRRLAEDEYTLSKSLGGGSKLEDPVGSAVNRLQYPVPLWSLLDSNLIAQALKEKGYGGVKLTEKYGKGDVSSQTIGVPHSGIRFRFAAFDPARINEKDLLAGFAALGIGLPVASGLLGEEQYQ
jgi:hypothetical protein